MNMKLSEINKQERLNFAENIRSIGLNRCVFLGEYELDEMTLWCAVTNLRESKLLIDYSGSNIGYYVFFLEEDVLPMWNVLNNLTLVNMKSRLSLLGSVAIGVGGAVAYQFQNMHEMEMTKIRQKHEMEQEIQLTKLRQQHEMDLETLSVLSKERRENMKFFRTCLAKNATDECLRSFKDVIKEMAMN